MYIKAQHDALQKQLRPIYGIPRRGGIRERAGNYAKWPTFMYSTLDDLTLSEGGHDSYLWDLKGFFFVLFRNSCTRQRLCTLSFALLKCQFNLEIDKNL